MPRAVTWTTECDHQADEAERLTAVLSAFVPLRVSDMNTSSFGALDEFAIVPLGVVDFGSAWVHAW
ncbi:hypothetical protein FIV07_06510 [Mycobacterium sp. THAF192]|nr:hypothetical protein FIV07_06510 [Mycobacterium sp. THAF192]